MGSLSVLIAILAMSFSANAHQPSEGKVLATLGPYLHQTQMIRSSDNARSPLLVGLGLLGEGDLSDYGGLEVGLFYFLKSYQRTFGNTHIVERVRRLSVPVGYRFWFNNIFSMGLGFTTAFSMGDFEPVFSDVTTGGVTSAEDVAEYGLDYSIQWQCWSEGDMAVVVDGRYSLSLSAKSNEDAHQYGVFVGFKYLIQDK